ncbi:MAG TPA: glycosyltransferase [Streptosporangiaceae bacterium]
MTVRIATIITRLEGGAGQLALRGAAALDPARFQVTMIVGSGALLGQAAAAGLEVIVEPGLRRAIDPRRDLWALAALAGLLRERSFDVVHTHTAKAGVLGRLAARRADVPRIVHTYHGFPFHEFQSRLRRSGYVAIERRLGRITDVALCVGTGVAVEVIRRGLVPPERVRTIGVVVDGVPESRPARASRERARLLLGVPADATVIGCVGRLAYQKAPEDFLAAIAAVRRPEVTGVWVGGGELAGRIGRLAAVRSIPRVVLVGERSDVLELLPAFDVFLLPSRYEGLPTVVVEAMACGIPVVATAVNAVPDLVVPGETGLLVPPGRPDLMADAVRYLLDHPATAARMADVARTRINRRFEIDALRCSLVAAYANQDHRVAMTT